ncbi:MAG: flagellar assembly protein FlbE [Brevundimonas sp.]|nr:MAG: flagellar assembly protein FlbE [Brevundimonas sp.]
MTQHRPFTFETEFDADGGVVRPSTFRPMKRSYMPAEVEALTAQARLEARQAALGEVESMKAQALNAIAQSVVSAMPMLAQVANQHREQSAALAMAAARSVSGAALDRFPLGAMQTALEALGQEIDASPRLVIRAPGLDDAGRAEIENLCADAGFGGQVAFRDGAGPTAAFQLEWADGRAEFDPDAAFGRIAEALSSALASEAGHAEALNERMS